MHRRQWTMLTESPSVAPIQGPATAAPTGETCNICGEGNVIQFATGIIDFEYQGVRRKNNCNHWEHIVKNIVAISSEFCRYELLQYTAEHCRCTTPTGEEPVPPPAPLTSSPETQSPTQVPTSSPSATPSDVPSTTTSVSPSQQPSDQPSMSPTFSPSSETSTPLPSPVPMASPSVQAVRGTGSLASASVATAKTTAFVISVSITMLWQSLL